MQRDSFIFYKDWANVLSDLPNDLRLEVYDAIIGYGLSGETKDLKPMAKIAFGFIKQDIDRNNVKRNEFIEKQISNGKKGGRPKNPKNPSLFLETQKSHNVNGNVNVNDNENENENEERKDKSFSKPSVSDVISYFDEKGYSKDAAITAFEYYDSADWKDSKGNRVRNWKQKMIAVWFKPENKKVSKSTISMY